MIDALDSELLALLQKRARLAQRIGALKGGAPAYRPERESEILRRVAAQAGAPLPAEAATRVFREIISACREWTEPPSTAREDVAADEIAHEHEREVDVPF